MIAQPSGSVTILNYTITASSTWESVGTIPRFGKAFRLRSRDGSSFAYAYSAAPSAYMTASVGEIVVAIGAVPASIYVYQSSGTVIEVEIWL